MARSTNKSKGKKGRKERILGSAAEVRAKGREAELVRKTCDDDVNGQVSAKEFRKAFSALGYKAE